MASRVLVLDANILIRAVLGNKVKEFLMTYHESVDFFTPDVCISDAQKYLPNLFIKRNLPVEPALAVLENIQGIIKTIESNVYKTYAQEAQRRIEKRDIQDWPIIATALALNCPIWTEDQDFFGAGLSTWTTDRIHIFFEKIDYDRTLT